MIFHKHEVYLRSRIPTIERGGVEVVLTKHGVIVELCESAYPKIRSRKRPITKASVTAVTVFFSAHLAAKVTTGGAGFNFWSISPKYLPKIEPTPSRMETSLLETGSCMGRKHISSIFRKASAIFEIRKINQVTINSVKSFPGTLVDPSPASLEVFHKIFHNSTNFSNLESVVSFSKTEEKSFLMVTKTLYKKRYSCATGGGSIL